MRDGGIVIFSDLVFFTIPQFHFVQQLPLHKEALVTIRANVPTLPSAKNTLDKSTRECYNRYVRK